MSRSKSMVQRLRERVALEMSDILLRTLEATYRQSLRLRHFTRGFVLSSLPANLHTELTSRAYARQPKLDKPGVPSGLSPWEEELVSHLPAPPAKILLGGCGDGREARILAERGYRIIAFDPTRKLIHRAKAQGPDSIEYLVGSYQELANPQTTTANTFHTRIVAQAPYDATYLGWASFSHVPNQDIRINVLKILRRLTPNGPIIMTILPIRNCTVCGTRAERAGYKAGRVITGRIPSLDEGDTIWPRGGFLHEFSDQEIQNVAKVVDGHLVDVMPDEKTGYIGLVIERNPSPNPRTKQQTKTSDLYIRNRQKPQR